MLSNEDAEALVVGCTQLALLEPHLKERPLTTCLAHPNITTNTACKYCASVMCDACVAQHMCRLGSILAKYPNATIHALKDRLMKLCPLPTIHTDTAHQDRLDKGVAIVAGLLNTAFSIGDLDVL